MAPVLNGPLREQSGRTLIHNNSSTSQMGQDSMKRSAAKIAGSYTSCPENGGFPFHLLEVDYLSNETSASEGPSVYQETGTPDPFIYRAVPIYPATFQTGGFPGRYDSSKVEEGSAVGTNLRRP